MRIGIDSGGTFTDVIAVDDAGAVRVLKLALTPDDPSRAVLAGVAALRGAAAAAVEVVHSTTVATNALLERRGGPTVLVTTAGFEDVLVLGRQARPVLYALAPELPPPLVPGAARLGLVERLGPGGVVWQALDEASLADLVGRVVAAAPRSVAVCLLHAYADGTHERRVRGALQAAGFAGPVSLSSVVLPEHREYERTITTVVDAYVAPVVGAYLARLGTALARDSLRVMLSSGGVARAADAAGVPARTALSGPAAGVVGALAVAERAGQRGILTFDMGGTSTDVAQCDGGVAITREAVIGGVPLALPVVDVHTVGAGGGSIARRDAGGALKVGPESAGADPGPACYGRGGRRPTVTDAHLVLGRLDERGLAGGTVPLSRAAAEAALAALAAELGLAGAEEAAAGVVAVAEAVMAHALRAISVRRGRDPRELTLVAFGGAGGLHACALAEELELPRVLAPAEPGLLCAYGALAAPIQRDHTRTLLTRVPAGQVLDAATLLGELGELDRAAREALLEEGVPAGLQEVQHLAELRYLGQSYELAVPLAGDLAAGFAAAHRERFGFALERDLELVTVRVIARGLRPPPPLPVPPREPGPACVGRRSVWFPGGRVEADEIVRARLGEGDLVRGPAVVREYSATTLVPPGWTARVVGGASLLLVRA